MLLQVDCSILWLYFYVVMRGDEHSIYLPCHHDHYSSILLLYVLNAGSAKAVNGQQDTEEIRSYWLSGPLNVIHRPTTLAGKRMEQP